MEEATKLLILDRKKRFKKIKTIKTEISYETANVKLSNKKIYSNSIALI